MTTFQYVAKSEGDTTKLGIAIADALPERALIALNGTLGAGKTNLTKAIAGALAVPTDRVVSPTFTLCNEYHGRRSIYHLDLYRIADEDELFEIGIEEYFQKLGLTLVEWADRYPNALPTDKLTVNIDVLDESERSFALEAETETYETLIGNVASSLKEA